MSTGAVKTDTVRTGAATTGASAGVTTTAGAITSRAILSRPMLTRAVRGQFVVGDRLIRLAIAMVWLYQGLWCKVLGGAPRHEAVIAAAPFIGAAAARGAMVAIGLVECAMALWVASRWQMRWAAPAQTALLVGMNAAGLVWARSLLADPAGMILQNFAFVLLIWIAAEDRRQNRREDRSHADHA
jgi:DoxX-like family